MKGKIMYFPVFHDGERAGAERGSDVKQWVERFMIPAGQASYDEAKTNCRLAVTGDGGFMRASRQEAESKSNKVIFGINRGRQGFLLNPVTDINQIPATFEEMNLVNVRLIRGTFYPKTGEPKEYLAFNDIVLGGTIMDYIKFTITGSLNFFQNRMVEGNGIIVATPQGVTGFVLKAGGGILPLDANNWYIRGVATGPYPNDIVTPQKVTIEAESRNPVSGYADGYAQTVDNIQKVVIEPTDHVVTLGFIKGIDFEARRTELARKIERGE